VWRSSNLHFIVWLDADLWEDTCKVTYLFFHHHKNSIAVLESPVSNLKDSCSNRREFFGETEETIDIKK
jgi:hypothetical protein